MRIAVCASWNRLPVRCGNSEMICPATSECRWVGTRTARPGEASSAVTNSAEHWKSLRAEQQPQGGLDEFGYRAALSCRLALEFHHDGIVDIDGSLHAQTPTITIGYAHMARWLRPRRCKNA